MATPNVRDALLSLPRIADTGTPVVLVAAFACQAVGSQGACAACPLRVPEEALAAFGLAMAACVLALTVPRWRLQDMLKAGMATMFGTGAFFVALLAGMERSFGMGALACEHGPGALWGVACGAVAATSVLVAVSALKGGEGAGA